MPQGCYRLVDRLLDGLEEGHDTFCDLTGLPDVMLLPPSAKLQVSKDHEVCSLLVGWGGETV